MNVEVTDLRWSAAARRIVDDISLKIESGAFVGILGPNGSGKSSLLRCVYRLFTPDAGSVFVGGDDVRSLTGREVALRMAVVLQEAPSEFDFTVHDVVSMGRTPHRRGWERHRREDEALVADALHRVGLGGFERRSYRSLSGGEKQRTLVARALVQQAPALILDEPTNHLDMRYQLEILRLVKELGTTVVAALHDLNLALLFCDQVAVLKDGRLRGWGLPQDVLTPSLIAEVYGVVADVVLHPRTGRRYLLFGAEEDSRLLSAMPEPCIAEAETAPSLITRTRR